jgi:XXXCH domain-containing protein
MQFKQLKQELETLFAKIKEASRDGDYPDLEDVKQFVRLCSQMQAQAPEEWAFEADDFTHLANELLQEVKQKQVQDIFPLIQSLDDAQNYCHRLFRE